MTYTQTLANWLEDLTHDDRFFGVVIGVVTDNKDPRGWGRVKLKFPWLSEAETSPWARIATPMAGKGRGFYFLPEVNDEVLVAFEHGEISTPYVLGSLWNGQEKPPGFDGSNVLDPQASEPSQDQANNLDRRAIVSRSGLTVLLDDTKGKEQICIQDKAGKNMVQIDAAKKAIVVTSDEGTVTIQAKGDVMIKSRSGDITLSGKNIALKAQSNCSIQANQACDVTANTGMNLKCSAGVKVNDGALEVI